MDENRHDERVAAFAARFAALVAKGLKTLEG